MNMRALALIGAVGLGALAVVLLHLGSDAPTPETDAVSVEYAGLDASAPEHGTASHPQLDISLDDLEARAARERALRERKDRPAVRPRPRHTTLAQLRKRSGWIKFLETWHFLRPEEDPAQRFERIRSTLARTDDPVVRQNLIFLAALALPIEVCEPWLISLRDAADPADAEDALCALAFSGEPMARDAFLRLAASPSGAQVHRLVEYSEAHEEIGKQATPEAREILRSYRCIEALDRAPYFDITAFLATHFRQGGDTYQAKIGWTDGYDVELDDRVALVEAWLERYPGHPGSDDMARRLGYMNSYAGNRLEAVRWFARAAVLPDQDKSYRAALQMVGDCEVGLTPEELLTLSEDEGLRTPHRNYFQYVWLRRLAAERGFGTALDAWETLATREPEGELGVAWRLRWSAAPAKGLDSGLTPLPADDPLRRVVPSRARWPAGFAPAREDGRKRGIYTGRSWRRDESKALLLHPWPDVVLLDREALVKQARAWCTLADLEARAEKARGASRADLLYKQAAVFHHDREVLYPAYGYHTYNFRGHLSDSIPALDEAGKRRDRERRRTFEDSSLSHLRAVALFERIEREHPDYASMDKVLFSQGISWKRLIDYRPHFDWAAVLDGDDSDRTLRSIRRAVAAFERCADRYPESTLSDDALAAAGYWRRTRPEAFR